LAIAGDHVACHSLIRTPVASRDRGASLRGIAYRGNPGTVARDPR
jgi:hypothetical protein